MSSAQVAVVSDTTCEIPPALAVELGIETAPLAVVTDGVAHGTELDVDTRALYRAMPGAAQVGTAAANVEGFLGAYERARDRLRAAGVERPGILCLALAKELSSTINNARLAAELVAGADVRVVDARSAVFGQGALVLEAARRAARGAPLSELEAWASEAAPRTGSYFATPSLRILQAIGRVARDATPGAGAAPAAGPPSAREEPAEAGPAASRYALVRIQDGRFVPFASASGDEEAVRGLVDAALADGFGRVGPLKAFFCHTLNPDLADRMEAAVREAFDVIGVDRRDDGALTAVLMGGTGGAGFGLLPVGGGAGGGGPRAEGAAGGAGAGDASRSPAGETGRP